MSTSFSRNGHAEYDDSDWQASIDYINDHQRFPRDQRMPCANPDCAALSAALFCSERCREQVEGVEEDDGPTGLPATFPAVSSLPEAPASINVRLLLHGRECQLTLRDSDEGRLLQRLAAVLQRFPVAAKPTDTTPQCPTHGPMKPSTKGKGWYCPTKLADGSWCNSK